MSDFEARMNRLGLTNKDSEGLAELSADRRMARAYCTSKKCSRSYMGTVKHVDQGKWNCPDCSDALVWRFIKLYTPSYK